MTTIHTIVVYVWFVPVLGFIVLPLVGTACGLLYRLVEFSKLSDMRGYVALNNRDVAGTGEVENRNRSRIHLEEGQACIDEKDDCCKVTVSNISNQGICLRNIPKRFFMKDSPFRIVFRTRQKDYSVTAKPVWKRMTGNKYVIGAKIEQVTKGWRELVAGFNELFSSRPAEVR